jgi:hypothetical protein
MMSAYPRTQELERLHGVTWSELVALEPELGPLLWEARQAGAACRDWSGSCRVFAPFRNLLSRLVGFASLHRHHQVLGSLGAYEVAYWKLYHAIVGLLPPPEQGSREGTSGAYAPASTHGLAGPSAGEMTNGGRLIPVSDTPSVHGIVGA